MESISNRRLGGWWGRLGQRWSLSWLMAAGLTLALSLALALPSQANAAHPVKRRVGEKSKISSYASALVPRVGKGLLHRAKFWWPASLGTASVLSKLDTGSWTQHVASLKHVGLFLGGGALVKGGRTVRKVVASRTKGKPVLSTLIKGSLGAVGVVVGGVVACSVFSPVFGDGTFLQSTVDTGWSWAQMNLRDHGLLRWIPIQGFAALKHGVDLVQGLGPRAGPAAASFGLGVVAELGAGRKPKPVAATSEDSTSAE